MRLKAVARGNEPSAKMTALAPVSRRASTASSGLPTIGTPDAVSSSYESLGSAPTTS